jgi:soluble lytic murein transglycosylase-like protein
MNANVSKNSLRLAMAMTLLFGGVVFEAASVGSAIGNVPLPPRKPVMIQTASLVSGDAADRETTTNKPGPLTDDEPAVPVASPAYKLVSATLRTELRQGRPTYAMKLLTGDPLAANLKNSEYDRLRAVIAQSYLTEGKLDKARDLAAQAVARSGKNAPLAGWVGGIASWRLQDYKAAAGYFAIAADSPSASIWLQSAGAYWASRALIRAGKAGQAEKWLQSAARHPRTFYGLIALRSLREDYDFNWSEPSIGWGQKSKLQSDSGIAEAFRLADAGQVNDAITRLGQSGWMRDRTRREHLMAYALKENQMALALHLARKTRDAEGNFYDSALYPVGAWEPEGGYKVDKALVYALIRQESRFNPHAKSGTGATGLMQLLPTTARYMNNGEEVNGLTSPETNISVGQKYVQHLLNDSAVNNDLFRMMIAYNAGPGNLARWKAQLKDVDDPLLFIESIPSPETRAFVERVMLNYWIYRIRMGQETPSLDAIADGDQMEYVSAGQQHDVRLASSN